MAWVKVVSLLNVCTNLPEGREWQVAHNTIGEGTAWWALGHPIRGFQVAFDGLEKPPLPGSVYGLVVEGEA